MSKSSQNTLIFLKAIMLHPSFKLKVILLVLLTLPAFFANADELNTSEQLKKLQEMVQQLQQ